MATPWALYLPAAPAGLSKQHSEGPFCTVSIVPAGIVRRSSLRCSQVPHRDSCSMVEQPVAQTVRAWRAALGALVAAAAALLGRWRAAWQPGEHQLREPVQTAAVSVLTSACCGRAARARLHAPGAQDRARLPQLRRRLAAQLPAHVLPRRGHVPHGRGCGRVRGRRPSRPCWAESSHLGRVSRCYPGMRMVAEQHGCRR